MWLHQTQEYTLLNDATVRKLTSSTNASPIVVTLTAHWFSTWDIVMVNWHATNTAANGRWTVTKVTADTFSLDDSTWNWIGWNTWAVSLAAASPLCLDFRNCILAFSSDGWGDAAYTIKVVWSIQQDVPDWWAPKTDTNQYDFIEMIDLEDWSAVDWDDWFVLATADDTRQFEVNINALRWISVIATAWTAGEVTVNCLLSNNA